MPSKTTPALRSPCIGELMPLAIAESETPDPMSADTQRKSDQSDVLFYALSACALSQQPGI